MEEKSWTDHEVIVPSPVIGTLVSLSPCPNGPGNAAKTPLNSFSFVTVNASLWAGVNAWSIFKFQMYLSNSVTFTLS